MGLGIGIFISCDGLNAGICAISPTFPSPLRAPLAPFCRGGKAPLSGSRDRICGFPIFSLLESLIVALLLWLLLHYHAVYHVLARLFELLPTFC